ncbi:MAG: pilus assembly protein [Chloroflexi bacterium]|nr:pilus assembly protein [Chloroflexota bacterium]
MKSSSDFEAKGIIEYILIAILIILIVRVLYNLLGPAVKAFIENLLESVSTS